MNDAIKEGRQDTRSEPSEKSTNKSKDSLQELVDVIVKRAKEASINLKTQLAGTFELFVRDRPFRVAFDFSTNPAKVLDSSVKTFDCVLEIDERTLLRIDQGELNPQLALLSDKVVVRGKSGMAVYFFNLLGD